MDENSRQSGIYDGLCKNVDSVVTIFTEACCFTGLLCSVHCGTVKLITRNNHGCPGGCCSGYYGKLTLIPICEINAVTFCNTSV